MQKKLQLGDLNIHRDWGWAPEYVEAMWHMLQMETAEDFVISTGETNSLETFCAMVFEVLDLDWKDHVTINQEFYRPSEIMMGRGDSSKAKAQLGWQAKTTMRGVIQKMIDAEMHR